MKNILVVGGAGYVGGYLVDVLRVAGYNVSVYDSLIYEERYLKDVFFLNMDVLDERVYDIANQYDVVIWLAAMVADGACDVDPDLTKQVNVDSVKKLVDRYKGKIIFMSTSAVYGVSDDELMETSKLNPTTLYTKTKLEAEQYIVNNHNNYLIFRLGTLFGLGDIISRPRFDLVANIFACRSAEGLPLTVNGGNQWRPWLHVKDVGGAIFYAIKKDITGLYNLSCGNMTIGGVAETARHIEQGTKIIYNDSNDVRNYRMSSAKYLSLGWEPKRDITMGMKEIYDLVNQKRIEDTSNPRYHNEKWWKILYGK